MSGIKMALGCALLLTAATLPSVAAAEHKPLITREDLPLKPRIMQISVRVADMARAEAFYTQVLGMRVKAEYQPSPGVSEKFFGFDDDRSASNIALVWIKSAPPAATAGGLNAPISFNLIVPDVQAVTDKVEAAGGKILKAPVTRPAGPFNQTMAFVADPDGTTIELVTFR